MKEVDVDVGSLQEFMDEALPVVLRWKGKYGPELLSRVFAHWSKKLEQGWI